MHLRELFLLLHWLLILSMLTSLLHFKRKYFKVYLAWHIFYATDFSIWQGFYLPLLLYLYYKFEGLKSTWCEIAAGIDDKRFSGWQNVVHMWWEICDCLLMDLDVVVCTGWCQLGWLTFVIEIITRSSSSR